MADKNCLGEWSCTKDTDEETRRICDQVRSLVEEEMKKRYQEYRAIQYIDLRVCENHFVFKVRVGEGNYIHVQVCQTRPCYGGDIKLIAVREETKDKPLKPLIQINVA